MEGCNHAFWGVWRHAGGVKVTTPWMLVSLNIGLAVIRRSDVDIMKDV